MRTLLAKALIIGGIILIILGGFVMLSGRISWPGKLPGDIHIKRDGFSFYFPITTCIIISIILSLLFLLLRIIRR